MCLQECYNYDTIMMKTVSLSYKNGIVQRCGQCVKEAIQKLGILGAMQYCFIKNIL